MSVETIKQELAKLSRDEQASVRDFLYALSIEQDDELRAEITRKLDSKDPKDWIPLDEALKTLGFSKDEIGSVD